MKTTWIIILVVVALGLFLYSMVKSAKKKDEDILAKEDEDAEDEDYLTKTIAELGEPLEVVPVPYLSPQADIYPILFYPDFVIINRKKINKSDLKHARFLNSSIPELPNNYAVIVETTDAENPEISVEVGNDIEYARNLAEAFTDYLRKEA